MNSFKNNKFSLILATKNSINNLKETIKSIKLQDYKNCELIVIDGASNDGTAEYLEKEKSNLNVIYRSEPDESLVEAYNKGWQLASGDIISPIATDERLFDKDVLSNINNQFNLHNDKSFLTGNCGFMNKDEEIIEISKPLKNDKTDVRNNLISHLSCENVLPMHSTFFKRKIIENFKFDLNVKHCGDYFFLANLFLKYSHNDFIFFDSPVLKAIKTRISSSFNSENFDLMIQSKISSLEKFCDLNKNIINKNQLNYIKSGIYMWAVEQISVMDNLSNQCLNYLNLAIKYNNDSEKISKFMKFHGIEKKEGLLTCDNNVSETELKIAGINFDFYVKNHHSFLKKFFFKLKKKEFSFKTHSYDKLLDIKVKFNENIPAIKQKEYWIKFDIFLIKGRIAISKMMNFEKKNEFNYKEKYFIYENNTLKIFYRLDNLQDLYFRIRNFGEYKSRFILENISLYYKN